MFSAIYHILFLNKTIQIYPLAVIYTQIERTECRRYATQWQRPYWQYSEAGHERRYTNYTILGCAAVLLVLGSLASPHTQGTCVGETDHDALRRTPTASTANDAPHRADVKLVPVLGLTRVPQLRTSTASR